MKSSTQINEILTTTHESEVLQYFIEKVALNRNALPVEVNHIKDDIFRTVEHLQKHLNEYKASIPEALATRFPDLVKKLCSQIETMNTAIEVFMEEILLCEVPNSPEALVARDENYSELVKQFNDLLRLEKELKRAVLGSKTTSENDASKHFENLNLNRMQREILDATIKMWFESILTSFSALNGLKAIFDEKIFKVHKPSFIATEILDTLNQIKAVLDHPWPQNRTTGNSADRIRKEPLGLLSLTAHNDKKTSPVTKKDVVIYISNAIKYKIAQLEAINFEKLIEDIWNSIEIDDFEKFEINVSILENNNISLDIFLSEFHKPLTYCARYGRMKMVKLLLEKNADVNSRSSMALNQPALWWASNPRARFDAGNNITVEQRCEIIRLLVKCGASLQNVVWDTVYPVLFMQTEILRLLLALGAEEKDLLNPTKIYAKLHQNVSVHEIDKEKLLFLQSHGIDLYKEDEHGRTIIDYFLSSYGGLDSEGKTHKEKNLFLIKFLFDNAYPALPHLKYVDPLGKAKILILNKIYVDFLGKAKISIDHSPDDTKELVEFIETYHAQQKPIIEAAGEIFAAFPTELLLEMMLKMNVVPIKFAQLALVCKHWRDVIMGSKEVFKKMVATANAKELSNLMKKSCLEGSIEKVSVLFSTKKISVNHRYNDNKTPLHYACMGGNAEVVALLLNNKADVTISDSEGNLPLHFAVQGDPQVCGLLLQFSSELVNVRNKSEEAPLDRVTNVIIAEMLIFHEAIRVRKDRHWFFKNWFWEDSQLPPSFDLQQINAAIKMGDLGLIKNLIKCFDEESKGARISELIIIAENLLDNPIRNEQLRKNITTTLFYLENVEKKYSIFLDNLGGVVAYVDFYFNDAGITDTVKAVCQNSLRIIFKNILKPKYSQILDENCSRNEFEKIQGSITAHLEHVMNKYLIIKSILNEADNIQKTYLFKGKEKATALRKALNATLGVIHPKIFEEDCSLWVFKQLILNTKNNALSVKEAFALDLRPPSLIAFFKFFGEKDDCEDPQNSPDKSFNA